MMVNPALQRMLSSGGIADIGTPKSQTPPSQGGEDFGKMLVNALEEVNGSQNEAKTIQQDFLTGRKPVEIHEVMIAQEKASTTMQLTLAVRNKALEAFQEINRLPV
ncbi:flagellar hook-basal body complex protein FliE [bacterium]|nr:MAG: flagellar hook-basal body complex protein FliE [bacterium]